MQAILRPAVIRPCNSLSPHAVRPAGGAPGMASVARQHLQAALRRVCDTFSGSSKSRDKILAMLRAHCSSPMLW